MKVNRYHIMGNGSDGRHVILEAFTGTRAAASKRAREVRAKDNGTWVQFLSPLAEEKA